MILRLQHSVERDGTGIKAREAYGWFAEVLLRADITQDVFVEQGSSGCPARTKNVALQRIEERTWH